MGRLNFTGLRSMFSRIRRGRSGGHDGQPLEDVVTPFVLLEPLERRVLLNGAPTLPGLSLVDPDITSWQNQVIYLDFDGAQDVDYNGPVIIEDIDVPAFAAPGHLAGQEQAIIAEVLTELEAKFADTGITFVTEEPEAGSPHSTIYIGGTDAPFADYGSFLGLAEKVDVGNQDPTDEAFVFAGSFSYPDATPDQHIGLFRDVIAHETGRLLGYASESATPHAGILDHVAATGQLHDAEIYGWKTIQDNGGWDNRAIWDTSLSGAPTGAQVTDVDVRVDISHTYRSDLVVVLATERNGTWYDYTLWNREGGSDDNIQQTWYNLDGWEGLDPNGTWSLMAWDEVAEDEGRIEEWEIWVDYTYTEPQPDLVISDLDLSRTSGYAGQDVTITSTTRNDGDSDTGWNVWSKVRYYLGRSSGELWREIGWGWTPNLQEINGISVGEEEPDEITWDVDADLSVGRYYITAVADADDDIVESDETDTRTVPFDVIAAPKPDLIVQDIKMEGQTNLSSVTVHTGDTVSIDALSKNVGDTSTTTSVPYNWYWGYSSGDMHQQITDGGGNDIDGAIAGVNGLQPGEDEWVSEVVVGGIDPDNWVVNLSPGTYWLTFEIDNPDHNDEKNEGNNIRSESFTVLAIDTQSPGAPGTPDLVTSSDLGQFNDDNLTSDDVPLTFSWSAATDYGTPTSGINRYEYRLNSGSWQSTGNGNNTSFTLTDPGDGTYTLDLRAVDNAGNPAGPSSSGLTFTIDSVNPNRPSNLTNPANSTTDTTPNVSWSAPSGTGSGIWKYEVWWDGPDLGYDNDFELLTSTNTTLDNSEYNGNSLTPGWWEWWVRAYDVAGNVSGWEPIWATDGVDIEIAYDLPIVKTELVGRHDFNDINGRAEQGIEYIPGWGWATSSGSPIAEKGITWWQDGSGGWSDIDKIVYSGSTKFIRYDNGLSYDVTHIGDLGYGDNYLYAPLDLVATGLGAEELVYAARYQQEAPGSSNWVVDDDWGFVLPYEHGEAAGMDYYDGTLYLTKWVESKEDDVWAKAEILAYDPSTYILDTKSYVDIPYMNGLSIADVSGTPFAHISFGGSSQSADDNAPVRVDWLFEGPGAIAVIPLSELLLYTDINSPYDLIGDGAFYTYLSNPHAEGLTFDGEGNLWVSRNTEVARLDTSAIYYPVVTPQIAMSTVDSVAGEPSNNGTFRITRTGSTAAPLTVNFSAPTGSANRGMDYDLKKGSTTLSGNSVTIDADQSYVDVTVAVRDDDIDEDNENVILQLGSGPGYTLGSTTEGTVTISDDDEAQVTVNPASGLVTTEPGGTASFTVRLDSQPTHDVIIGLSSSDTTEGALSTNSLTFTPSDWDQEQEVTVTGVDDDDVDGDLAYTIVTAPAVSNDPKYNGLNPANVSVTNEDNDIPQLPALSIMVPDGSVAEPLNHGLLRISRTGPTDTPLTVQFVTTGNAVRQTGDVWIGLPDAEPDYRLMCNGVRLDDDQVVIPAGKGSVDLVLEVIADGAWEGTEEMTLVLLSGIDYTLGGISWANVFIDDFAGILPGVEVFGDGWFIADNDSSPSAVDHTEFGSVTKYLATTTRTFTVTSTGTSTLALANLQVPEGFAIVEGLDSSIAPGESDTFTVRLKSTSVGAKSGDVTFDTNGVFDGEFKYRVAGLVTSNGDVNGDGVVNDADRDVVEAYFGQNVTGGESEGDLNGDGMVNVVDLIIIGANWLHIDGDANGDGVVNALDLSVVGANWLASVDGGSADGDFNGDGIVNALDLSILGTNWLQSAQGGGVNFDEALASNLTDLSVFATDVEAESDVTSIAAGIAETTAHGTGEPEAMAVDGTLGVTEAPPVDVADPAQNIPWPLVAHERLNRDRARVHRGHVAAHNAAAVIPVLEERLRGEGRGRLITLNPHAPGSRLRFGGPLRGTSRLHTVQIDLRARSEAGDVLDELVAILGGTSIEDFNLRLVP